MNQNEGGYKQVLNLFIYVILFQNIVFIIQKKRIEINFILRRWIKFFFWKNGDCYFYVFVSQNCYKKGLLIGFNDCGGSILGLE